MAWAEEVGPRAWRACWRDAGGRKRSRRSFRTKADAMRYAAEEEAKARRGDAPARQAGRSISWGAWCDRWLAARVAETDETARIERHLRPTFGPVPLNRITADAVQAWCNALVEAGLAPATVVRTYGILSSSLTAAVRAGELGASPLGRGVVELPTVPPGPERFLTREEVDAVLYHLNDPYRAAVEVLVGTGLRFGELAGLHEARYDTVRGLVRVVDTFAEGSIKPYPKDEEARYVPVVGWVADALARVRRPRRDGCGVRHRDGKPCRSWLCITGPDGAPLHARNLRRRHWLPALAAAGVEPARLHDLRHTAASWMVQAGLPLGEVAAILGHSSILVTQRYAHFAPERFSGARSALEAFAPGAVHADVVDLADRRRRGLA